MTRPLVLVILSALLFSLPWYEPFSGLLLLIAFVPLLFAEERFAKYRKKGFWKYAWLCFFLWNAATTWWIANATFWGMIGALFGNSVQMLIVFLVFRLIKQKTNQMVGYTAFVAFWLLWEWFYFDAEITWPWLTLGNGFAKDIRLIQWYENTGVLGGSLWVLISNLLVFFTLKKYLVHQKNIKTIRIELFAIILIWLLPCGLSLFRFHNYTEQQNICNVVILQPNIDPFNEKFGGLTQQQQQNIIMEQATNNVDSLTHYLIAPETSFEGNLWEHSIENNSIITRLKKICRHHAHLSFIAGAVTYHRFSSEDTPPPTARKANFADFHYDVYNTAMQIDSSNKVQLYHKSKLVVGVEMLPYPKYLNKLALFAINLGGTIGKLGTQKEREVFSSPSHPFRAGVAICYESIFGQFFTEYIKRGANVMVIITNDGWWKNTPGHRQHLEYASLRAIETRRSIARSANTGISAIINQRGEIEHRTQWWTRTTLSGTINANEYITPYVMYGDIIGRIAALLSLLIIGYTVQYTIRKR
ncbi:MAG: apolipoprotein N-acyltransferase [Bacteroidales bacterium]